eukprot:c33929_g1_i1 orf=3-206(-)
MVLTSPQDARSMHLCEDPPGLILPRSSSHWNRLLKSMLKKLFQEPSLGRRPRTINLPSSALLWHLGST